MALIGLAFLVLAGVAVADPVARFEDFKQPAEASDALEHRSSTSGSGRYQFWSAAVDAFEHEPLTGIGAGGYQAWWNQHGSITRFVRDAHSVFFEMLAELGIGGLLLIVSFVVLGVVQGWRRRRGGSPDGSTEVALAVLLVGLIATATDWTWELGAVFAPVVVVIGLLTGPATVRRDSEPESGGRSFGWGVATLLAGWAAVWTAGLLLVTEVRLDDSRAAVDRGDLAQAAQDASDASTLQPWAAEPRLQRALVEERAGNLPAARVRIGEAIDRAPEDWSLWYAAARIDYKAGNRHAYAAEFERALALNPRASFFLVQPLPAPRETGDKRGATAAPVGSPW